MSRRKGPLTLSRIEENTVKELPPADPLARYVNGECWVWQGTTSGAGYGQVYHEGRMRLVHRVVLALRGEDIDGLDVDHLCRVPACCNPDHLEAVTHRENIRRGKTPRSLLLARRTKCESMRGRIRRKRGGIETWTCFDCDATEKRTKRLTATGLIENRSRARAMRAEGTSVNWRNYMSDLERGAAIEAIRATKIVGDDAE